MSFVLRYVRPQNILHKDLKAQLLLRTQLLQDGALFRSCLEVSCNKMQSHRETMLKVISQPRRMNSCCDKWPHTDISALMYETTGPWRRILKQVSGLPLPFCGQVHWPLYGIQTAVSSVANCNSGKTVDFRTERYFIANTDYKSFQINVVYIQALTISFTGKIQHCHFHYLKRVNQSFCQKSVSAFATQTSVPQPTFLNDHRLT